MTLPKISLPLLILAIMAATGCKKESINTATVQFTMPAEDALHEGTWLQWPHDYDEYPVLAGYEPIWIEMTRALHTGERVHIVVYNEAERTRVSTLLQAQGLDMSQIDFQVWETNDPWVRDNGPIFVRDKQEQLTVLNFGFNGWGNKAPYAKNNEIPGKVSSALQLPRKDVDLINEGGAIEVDGHGTLMAKLSSIDNNNRNPGRSVADIEAVFTQYLGVTNFIWLKGFKGGDITDDHIDGTARFGNATTIVTVAEEDANRKEFSILSEATNANGERYDIVELPATEKKLAVEGSLLKAPGSYINYYIGNQVILVPNYNDPMDEVANARLQALYPYRTVVGINVLELWRDGGAIHCVTQQQPL